MRAFLAVRAAARAQTSGRTCRTRVPRPDRRESSAGSMAFEARCLIEPPASHGPRISWAGPRTHLGTPAPMDGWPHTGDGAGIVRQTSSQERGSSAVEADGVPDANVRRLTGEMAGGGRSDGRLTLRRPNLRVAGGVLLLLSPFMDGWTIVDLLVPNSFFR